MGKEATYILIGVLGSGLAAEAAVARSSEPVSEASEASHVRVSAVMAPKQVAPGGEARLLVTFVMEDGWHIYWRNPGESGAPTKVSLTVPAGATSGQMIWPAPVRMVMPGNVLDYVYEGEATFVVPLTVAASAAPGSTLRVGVNAEWFMCTEDVCVPGEGGAEATLIVGGNEPRAGGPAGPALEDASLPRTTPPAGFETTWRDGALTMRAPGAARLAFFEDSTAHNPAMPRAVNPLRDGACAGETLTMEFAPDSLHAGSVVTGVLTVERAAGGRTHHEISIAAPGAAGTR